MAYKVLILGASYGSLLGTKLLMAGHDVTLVCRATTAKLFNANGSDVRIKLRDEDTHRAILSADLPGSMDAMEPSEVDVDAYDMVALAMSEPQYGAADIRALLSRIAKAGVPCLSIMNMPPLPYLKRIKGLDTALLEPSFTCPEVWADFDPDLVTLCSPDPQAYRLPDGAANVLHVGLPTNFKAAKFAKPAHNEMLTKMADDIAAVTIDGKDVPVKLRVYDSLFVPFAKWSLLLTGNYRCVQSDSVRSIRDAVHSDPVESAAIYAHVDGIARGLGASGDDQVPFEKYAKAANSLLKPSSAARAIDGGAAFVERVDMLVSLIGKQMNMENDQINAHVEVVNMRLKDNRRTGG